MTIVRALLALLVATLLAPGAFAQTPPASTQPWSLLPLDGYGIDPAELARLTALPVYPDLLEPLWDPTSQVTLVTNALGPPDVVDGVTSRWDFATVQLTIYEVSSVSSVEFVVIDPPDPRVTRAFDSRGLPLEPVLAAVTGRCQDVLARLGQPTVMVENQYAWVSAGRGRDAAITLECVSDTSGNGQVLVLRFTQCEAPPRELAALLASSVPPVRLPARFKQVTAQPRVLDPRELWPRGFVPGDSVAGVFEKIGAPSLLDSSLGTQLLWGFHLGAIVAEGTLRQVALTTPGRAAAARLGVTSPLFPLLGRPVATLIERLGRPNAHDPVYTWRWTAEGHELSITAAVVDGILTQLSFIWVPAPRREALPCAALLEQRPSRIVPKPVIYTSRDVSVSSAQLVPFGLWFGANHRDVTKRLGLPRRCDEDGRSLEFQGIELHFFDGGLSSVSVQPEFLSADHFATKGPLVTALFEGVVATEAFLGGQLVASEFGGVTGTFEHGAQRIEVEIEAGVSDSEPQVGTTTYRVRARRGFDFAIITGLRLDRLPTTGRAALALPPLDNVAGVFGDALVLRVADKPALKSKVGGKLYDLLGAPWNAATKALGAPTQVKVDGDKVVLIWAPTDPLGRMLAFVCTGAKPTCNELHLRGPRE